MADRRIGGVLYIKCTTQNGGNLNLAIRGKWKVTPTKTKKEGIAGQDGVHGYKEMPVVPTMEGDISDTATLDLKKLDEAVGITATAELANGKVYVGVDGWRADVSSIETEEGSIGVKLEFMSVDQVR
jgi:hypothetical protein